MLFGVVDYGVETGDSVCGIVYVTSGAVEELEEDARGSWVGVYGAEAPDSCYLELGLVDLVRAWSGQVWLVFLHF